jgi:hypothetical protein
MIAAMHPGMTVHARLPEHGACDTCSRIEIIEFITMRIPGMRLMMALLAELRCAPHKGSRMNRSMRIMTDGAILEDRLMLPQEGAAFLGMTGIAIVIGCNLAQFRLARRFMCLVTIIALHLPVTEWMTELLQGL